MPSHWISQKKTDRGRRKCTKEEEFLHMIISPDLSRIAPVFPELRWGTETGVEQQIWPMLASSLRLCNQCGQSLPAVLKELIQPKGFRPTELKKSTALTPLSLNIQSACSTQTHAYNLQSDSSIDCPIHHSQQTWTYTITHMCGYTCLHACKLRSLVITFITCLKVRLVLSKDVFLIHVSSSFKWPDQFYCN